MTDTLRDLSEADAKGLKPGTSHYTSYVGPPGQYDLMGAMQFRLLTTLGLRDGHKLLDFGCGSLRAGRLFIPYLQPGCYFGLEPNHWLVEDAIDRQIGRDMIRLKQPTFARNDDFKPAFGDHRFDFVLAQSIFSHAGLDVVAASLSAFRSILSAGGIVVATFSMSDDGKDFDGRGWVYPACVGYTHEAVLNAFSQSGLSATAIPFYHPRQRWYLGALDRSVLPQPRHLSLLAGAVFNVPEFSASLDAPDA